MKQLEYLDLTARIKENYPSWKTNKDVEKLLAPFPYEKVCDAFLAHLEVSQFPPKYCDWVKQLKKIDAKPRIPNKEKVKKRNEDLEKAINAYLEEHNKLPDHKWYAETLRRLKRA